MKFNTSYCPAKSISEPKCPTELNDYLIDEVTGELVATEKIPFYKEIQSYYESTKLSTKLTRYTMGDVTALGFDSGSYVDVSGQSTNLATVLNTHEVAKGEFNKLPSDIRKLFNDNFTEFINCVNDGSFEQRIVEYAKSKQLGGNSGAGDNGAGDNGSAAS